MIAARAVVLVGALVAVCACTQGNTVPERLSRGTPPFTELSDVELGMRAQKLTRIRSGARPAAYVGYEEAIGDYHVAYRFPGSYSEEQVVPGSSRLFGITTGRHYADPLRAEHGWRRTIAQMSEPLGPPPECLRHAGRVNGKLAIWKVGRTKVSAEIYGLPERDISQRAPPDSAVVIVRIERKRLAALAIDALLRQKRSEQHLPERTPEPCPARSKGAATMRAGRGRGGEDNRMGKRQP